MLVNSFCDHPQAHCAAQEGAVVMIVGRTPTVMTHKPTARPGETPLEMLVDSD